HGERAEGPRQLAGHGEAPTAVAALGCEPRGEATAATDAVDDAVDEVEVHPTDVGPLLFRKAVEGAVDQGDRVPGAKPGLVAVAGEDAGHRLDLILVGRLSSEV